MNRRLLISPFHFVVLLHPQCNARKSRIRKRGRRPSMSISQSNQYQSQSTTRRETLPPPQIDIPDPCNTSIRKTVREKTLDPSQPWTACQTKNCVEAIERRGEMLMISLLECVVLRGRGGLR
ncbi:hypothetical protein VTL71DRAFT_16363 [Oculimacula yallundae]|uniref:Uncharacterized protein n=1 Tax=Oculimacula yallundae TaxID=86028 RepID=A0ABR4CE95_9HELO